MSALSGYGSLLLMALRRFGWLGLGWLGRRPSHPTTLEPHLLSQVPDALLVLDQSGRVVAENAPARALLGRLQGRVLSEVSPGLSALNGELRLALGGRVLHACAGPLRGEDGAPQGRVLSLRDVSAETEAAQATARRAAFQETLLEALQTLLSSEGEGLYQRMLEQAIRMMPEADAGSVLLRAPDGRFDFVAAFGYELSELKRVRFEPGELYHAAQLHQQRPVVVRDLGSHNDRTLDAQKNELLERVGASRQIKAVMAAPVYIENELFAVVSLDSVRSEHAFGPEVQARAEMFARYLGGVLHRSSLKERLERVAKVQSLLVRIERLLLESDSLQVFFPLLADLLIESGVTRLDQLTIFEKRSNALAAHVHACDTRRDRAVARALWEAGLLSDWETRVTPLRICMESQRPIYLEDAWQDAGWLRLAANPSRTILTCPLLRRGEVWGAIEFAADAPGAFNEDLRELLTGVAESAELALSRHFDREQLELGVAKLGTVVATAEIMRGLASRQQVFDAAVAAVLQRTRATSSTLLEHDPTQKRLHGRASLRADGRAALSFQGQFLERGRGMAWRVFDGDRTLHINDLERLKGVLNGTHLQPTSDYIGAPLRDQHNRPAGVLVAAINGFAQSFEAADVAFLEAIAQATSSALIRLELLEEAEARASAYQELYRASERQSQELALLDHVRTAVARSLELEGVIARLVQSLHEAFGYALVSVYWLEGDALSLSRQVGYAEPILRLPLEAGVMGRSVREGRPLLIPDVQADPYYRSGVPGVTSEIAVPIHGREGIVAVFNVETLNGQVLDEADLKLMVALGEQVGIALERALLHQDVRGSEQRFRLLAENMTDLVCIHAPDGTFGYVSPSSQVVLGYLPQVMTGQPLAAFIHPDDLVLVLEQFGRSLVSGDAPQPFCYRIRHADGRELWFETVAQPLLEDGKLKGFTSSSRDVSERRVMEERLRHDALYDSLTGLPNRALFLNRLGQLLSRRDRGSSAVLFIDLDRFKMVNDSLGHGAGDALLREMGRRLLSCVRPEDIVARLGGDEFCVLLETLAGETEALEVAERVQQALSRPVALLGRELYPGASIGVAFAGPDTASARDLLRDADLAMYRAKSRAKQGAQGGYAVFDQTMHQEAIKRLTLESDLHRALERNELSLAFQPIFELGTAPGRPGTLAGLEALARWQHPERGLLLPEAFIPLAEETGLIVALDRWALREACRQRAVWARQGLGPHLSVSVNLSGATFAQGQLVGEVHQALLAHGLGVGVLKLEVAERDLMADAEASSRALGALGALGVGVQVADFGTGYSSLQHLHALPLEGLKMDASFVWQLGEDGDSAVVRSVLALAEHLGLTVVAEGVETEAQLGLLRALGCLHAQGYALCHPLSAADLEAGLLRPESALAG